MPTCAIYGCDNRTENIRGTNISLHRFPKDKKVCSDWVKACKRGDKFTIQSYRICSIHFDEMDYQRDLKAELLNLDRKPKLKPNAVPHLNLYDKNREKDELLQSPPKKRKTLNSSHASLQEAAEIEAVVERRKIVEKAMKDVTCSEELNFETHEDTTDPSDEAADGTTINAKPLHALLKLTATELTVCPQLKELHLSCRGPERQNVRLAANLISRTVGTALVHYKPGDDEKLAVDTGNFILLMNEWFGMMNAYTTKYSMIPSQTAYGMEHLDAQSELLINVRNVILGMRCYGKESWQIFQKGIIMGITALPMLL